MYTTRNMCKMLKFHILFSSSGRVLNRESSFKLAQINMKHVLRVPVNN